MKNYKNERKLSTVAALLLFTVFAVGVFSVLFGGTRIYRNLVQRDAATYDSRTGCQYLMSKLRQAPEPQAVGVSQFEGLDTLLITETIDGDMLVTRIYCYNGWLMELYSFSDSEFSPEDGEKVLPAKSFSVTQQQDLLLLELTDENGKSYELRHTLRGWEGSA